MSFTAIDLSLLPAPTAIEDIDYEYLLQQWRDYMLAKQPELTDTLDLESEPLVIAGEAAAYIAMLIYQRINEAVKATMLAYASGSDLDQLSALLATQRKTDETDDQLRARAQLSFERISTAGAAGSYKYHALAAHDDVLDASAYSPQPGVVVVTVLTRNGIGIADNTVIEAVNHAVNADTIRPISDTVVTQAANIHHYTIDAVLYVGSGPSADIVKQNAMNAANAFVNNHRSLGLPVPISGIHAALHVEQVQRVELLAPVVDFIAQPYQSAYCDSITIGIEVTA